LYHTKRDVCVIEIFLELQRLAAERHLPSLYLLSNLSANLDSSLEMVIALKFTLHMNGVSAVSVL